VAKDRLLNDGCARRTGVVIALMGTRARVQLEPSVCSNCPMRGGCSSIFGEITSVDVDLDTSSARVGDQVTLMIQEARAIRAIGRVCALLTIGGALAVIGLAAAGVTNPLLQFAGFLLGALGALRAFPGRDRELRFAVLS